MFAKYDAMDIARHIINYCENELKKPISNLRLQKILYYAQGLYLVIYEEPLFDNKIEAWAYGPVVPDVYYSYNNFGSNEITGISDDNTLLSKDAIFINEVINRFIDMDVWNLVKKTHNESPWKDNYIKGQNKEISIYDIESWFLNQQEED